MATKPKTVADGVLRVREAEKPADVPRWLNDLDMWASAHLNDDKSRPGAKPLKEVKGYYTQFRNAAGRDPETATWAALRMLQAMWIAQMMDGRQMIDGGVKRYRAAETQNRTVSTAAERQRELWRKQAADLRANPKHAGKGKSDIASLIDKDRWNTVRRYI